MGASNAKPKDIVVPVPEPTPEIVVGQLVPDDTESFVLPEQYAVMKNIIDGDKSEVFGNYLRNRATVPDRDLQTRELKLLFDAGAFTCAERYVMHVCTTHTESIDYNVALASRHATLTLPPSMVYQDAIVIIGYMQVFKTMKWEGFHLIESMHFPLFTKYRSYHSFAIYSKDQHGIEFACVLDDPAISYDSVACWLRYAFRDCYGPDDARGVYTWTMDPAAVGAFLMRGAYRVAYYCVNRLLGSDRKWETSTVLCDIVSPYLGELLNVRELRVPDQWYSGFLCGKRINPTGAKYLAQNKTFAARAIECADLNETSANLDIFMRELPDDIYARAIELVWKVPRRQRYEKLRLPK